MSRPKISAILVTVAAIATVASLASSATIFTAASGSNLRGVTHINTDRTIRGVLLSDFELKFSNGDHKISEIGFVPSSDQVKVGFRDFNADDPYSFLLNYREIKTESIGSRILKVSKTSCGGTCTLTIPESSSMRFGLLGFWFKRQDGDANVKRLAVRPRLSQGAIDVVYHDNKIFKYDVEIYYALYSKSIVQSASTKTASGGNKVVWTTISTGAPNGRTVIEGFDVRYTDTDHYLQHFAIKPADKALKVAFGDKNYDDPYSATIDYAVLNSDAFR